MFLSALSCTYILSIDIKPLKTLCRKGFACMGILSAMESLSDALNVLFFALLSGYITISSPRSMPDITKHQSTTV